MDLFLKLQDVKMGKRFVVNAAICTGQLPMTKFCLSWIDLNLTLLAYRRPHCRRRVVREYTFFSQLLPYQLGSGKLFCLGRVQLLGRFTAYCFGGAILAYLCYFLMI